MPFSKDGSPNDNSKLGRKYNYSEFEVGHGSISMPLSVSDIEKELFDKSEVRLKNDTEVKMKT